MFELLDPVQGNDDRKLIQIYDCSAPTESNCHPFRCGRFLFMHNGVVGRWDAVRREILTQLKSPMAFNFAMENTPIDSVVLFAMFIELLDRGGKSEQPAETRPIAADADYSANEIRLKMQSVLKQMKTVLDFLQVEEVSYLNCVVSDGKQIIATRYSVGPYTKRCSVLESGALSFEIENPAERVRTMMTADRTQSLSLYFATGTRWVSEGQGGDYRMMHSDKRNEVCIITSEPLTEVREEWVPVPHNHLVIVSSSCDVLLQPLDSTITKLTTTPTLSDSQSSEELGTMDFRGPFEKPECNVAVICRSLQSLEATAISKFVASPPRVPLSNGGRSRSLLIRALYLDRCTSGDETSLDISQQPSTIQCLQMLPRVEGTEPVLCAASLTVHGNKDVSQLLFSGDGNGNIRVWSMETWKCLATIKGHRGSVLALLPYVEEARPAYNIETHLWLFSASSDTTVCVWNISKLLCNLQAESKELLSLRLYFEPLQGDVLSLAILPLSLGEKNPGHGKTKLDDFMFFGYQSTAIGYIRLGSIFKRIHLCKHFQVGFTGDWCNPSCAAGTCVIGPHINLDFMGAKQLILSGSNIAAAHDDDDPIYPPTIFLTSGTHSMIVNNRNGVTGVPAMLHDDAAPSSDTVSQSDRSDAGPKSAEQHQATCRCALDWYLLQYTTADHHCGFIEALACSGKYLISGGGDGLVLVWKGNVHVCTLSGHTGGVLCLATAAEDATFYSGSRDQSIRMWDLNSRSCKQVLRGHSSDVMTLTLTTHYLVSASTSNEILVWSRRWHEIVYSLASDGIRGEDALQAKEFCVTSLITLNQGRTVAATGSDGLIRFWDMPELDGAATEESHLQLSMCPKANGGQSTAESLLRELIPLISISGEITFLGECWRTAKLVCSFLDDLGAETRLISTGPTSAPIVLGRIGHDPTKPTVLLYSHYDVVGSGESDENFSGSHHCSVPASPPKRNSATNHWNTDPWSLILVNGYLCGRGVSDNKGPLVAQIVAVSELIEGNYDSAHYAAEFGCCNGLAANVADRLPVNLIFVSEGEEENGSLGFDRFLIEQVEILKQAQYAIFTNTYWLDDERPCLVYGMRGVIDMQITISGGDHPFGLHSGVHGGAVIEPLTDLLAIAAHLVDADGVVLVPHFYDDVAKSDLNLEVSFAVSKADGAPPKMLTPQRRSSWTDFLDLERYKKETGNAGVRNLDARELLKRRWLQPSLSITEVWSSTQTSPENLGRNYRILPSRVGLNLSVRFVPFQKASHLVKCIEDFVQSDFAIRKSPNLLEIKVLKCHDWWQGDPSSPLFRAAGRAISSVWGIDPLCTREGGTIPVIQRVQDSLSLSTVQLPIGQASDNAHLPNERLGLSNLHQGIEVLKMTLWGLAHQQQRVQQQL